MRKVVEQIGWIIIQFIDPHINSGDLHFFGFDVDTQRIIIE